EVYEVATFYHHFDVVKEGEAPPPAITVRVCDSIACEMAGSRALLDALPALLGADVRVLHAPCVGRCDAAPVAVVGQNPVPVATASKVNELVKARAVKHLVQPGHIDYASYRAAGGYEVAASCVAGRRAREEVMAALQSSGLRGLGGAGFPAGRKWQNVAAEPQPRPVGVKHDRSGPGTVQEPGFFQTDPPPLPPT